LMKMDWGDLNPRPQQHEWAEKRNRKKIKKNNKEVLKHLISNVLLCGGCGSCCYGGSVGGDRDKS
jgi:hypothetical protein